MKKMARVTMVDPLSGDIQILLTGESVPIQLAVNNFHPQVGDVLEVEEVGGQYRLVNYTNDEPVGGKMRLNKTAYLLICVFLGFMGGEYFYVRNYKMGLLMILLMASGIPVLVGFYQAIKTLGIPADQDGFIYYTKTPTKN